MRRLMAAVVAILAVALGGCVTKGQPIADAQRITMAQSCVQQAATVVDSLAKMQMLQMCKSMIDRPDNPWPKVAQNLGLGILKAWVGVEAAHALRDFGVAAVETAGDTNTIGNDGFIGNDGNGFNATAEPFVVEIPTPPAAPAPPVEIPEAPLE